MKFPFRRSRILFEAVHGRSACQCRAFFRPKPSVRMKCLEHVFGQGFASVSSTPQVSRKDDCHLTNVMLPVEMVVGTGSTVFPAHSIYCKETTGQTFLPTNAGSSSSHTTIVISEDNIKPPPVELSATRSDRCSNTNPDVEKKVE